MEEKAKVINEILDNMQAKAEVCEGPGGCIGS